MHTHTYTRKKERAISCRSRYTCELTILATSSTRSPHRVSPLLQVCGYTLCIANAMAYALYEVLYKKFVHLLETADEKNPLAKVRHVRK